MNKTLAAVIVAAAMLTACGAENKVINGVEYGTYGLMNKSEMMNPNIQYEISGWSIFWSVILVETVIAPIYFIGWDMYQPLGKKDPNWVPGQVNPVK